MSQTPDVIIPKRDALGWACFLVHIGILVFIVTGWALRPVLIVYLVFVPVMVLQWHLNKGACILNNLESLIRTGRWRDPLSREEGVWLKTLIHDVTGWQLTARHVDLISYAVMTVLWGVALWRATS